jgi:flagellar hook assembly protein FlgD
VRLDIYDLQGRRLATLHNGALDAGMHTLSWDGRDAAGRVAAGGIYLVRCRNGQAVYNHKIILAK